MHVPVSLLTLSLHLILILSMDAHGQNKFDRQAHRGGRGLMPENTILSEKNAIDFNTTMEMDLQMTKDKKIVVSHDAFLNHLFVLTPEGDTLTKAEGENRLIYDMTYDSLRQYDVGSKPHPDFPEQQNVSAERPRLDVLIDSVEAYAKRKGKINYYNIELKSREEADGKHYPNLKDYVNAAIQIIENKGIENRVMIQSFDERALRMVHKKWPDIELSYLVMGGEEEDVDGFIKALGFQPDVFSPNYKTCTPERIRAFHRKGIRVIPWTPDTVEDMQRLKNMGVDGEITDFPNLYKELE